VPCLMSMEGFMRSTTSVLIEPPFSRKGMVDGTKVIVPGTALSSMSPAGPGCARPLRETQHEVRVASRISISDSEPLSRLRSIERPGPSERL
jgi:hypothetical protein